MSDFNGDQNGNDSPENRAGNGQFRKGGRGGPGRPRKPRLADDPEAIAFAREMREAGERFERMFTDIASGVLSGWEATQALRIERAAWRLRGKRLRDLERRQR